MSGEKTEGGLWGGAAERERANERAELLSRLAPEHREKGARLLEACEQGGLGTTAYIASLASLVSMLQVAKSGKVSDEQLLDLLKETLAFYRSACIAENSKFIAEEILGEVESLEEFAASLQYGFATSAKKMQQQGARVQLLLEGLEGNQR